jgi:tetratricopeptide (TPR) repeat protein
MRRLITVIGLATLLAGTAAAADSLGDVRAGNAAFGDGRYEIAVDAYTRAILAGDLDPEALAVAFNNRGVAFSELGDYDRAIQDYGKTLELKSGDKTALKNLRIAHTRRAGAGANLGDQAAALADYAKAIELDPEHPLAYLRRGQLLLNRGETAAAVEDLQRAQALDPANRDVAALLDEANRASAAAAASPPAEAGAPTETAAAAPTEVPPPAPQAEPRATEATPALPAAPATTPPASATAAVEPTAGPSRLPAAPGDGEGRPYRVLADVNLREGPGNDFPRSGSLARGTTVLVTGEKKGWLQIRLRNGGTGFVYKKWLEAEGGGNPPQ